jgi:hypothetical protein
VESLRSERGRQPIPNLGSSRRRSCQQYDTRPAHLSLPSRCPTYSRPVTRPHIEYRSERHLATSRKFSRKFSPVARPQNRAPEILVRATGLHDVEHFLGREYREELAIDFARIGIKVKKGSTGQARFLTHRPRPTRQWDGMHHRRFDRLSVRLRSPPVSDRAGLQGCVAEGRAVANADDLVGALDQKNAPAGWHIAGTADRCAMTCLSSGPTVTVCPPRLTVTFADGRLVGVARSIKTCAPYWITSSAVTNSVPGW